MKKEMLINVLQPEECRIAIVEDGVLEELYVERTSLESFTGNIYKGRIVNLEPAIQAAFVDFSVGRNGFLHVSDVEPQYYDRPLGPVPEPASREGDRPRGRSRGRDRDRDRGRGRDRDEPRPSRLEGRDDSETGEDRDRGRDEPRPTRDWDLDWDFGQDRPDRSEKGRKDRSRRFGEGLTDEPEEEVEAPAPSDPSREEPVSDEPGFGWAEPPASLVRAAEGEPEPEPVQPEPPSEIEASLPPSRTRGRRAASASAASSSEEAAPPAKKPRRGRGRKAAAEPAPEPEAGPEFPSTGPVSRPGPFAESAGPLGGSEAPDTPETPSSAPDDEPIGWSTEARRPRGGRDAIRARGGDRAPGRPRAPEPLGPDPFESPRPERPSARGRDRDRDRDRDQPRRERPAAHDRAGEPGYVPRRERGRTSEPAGYDPELGWSEPEPGLAEPEPGGPLLDSESETEFLDEPSSHEEGRPRRRRRRRRRGDRETEAPSLERGGSDVEERAPSARRRPARLDHRDDEDAGFDDLEGDEDDELVLDTARDAQAAGDEIEPELEDEIRREIEEIYELEREMGLRGTTEARPRRGDDREPRGGRGRGPSKPPVQEIFRRGDEVLVQVIKESIGTKGPTLSTYISIPGRYLVLMPGLNRVGVSRKIADEAQRRRLREIMNALDPPKGLGFIVRTAGLDRTKRELAKDLAYLLRLWKVILRRIKKTRGPAPIYQESDMIIRTIRDIFSTDIDTIWIDEPHAFERAQEFLRVVMPRHVNRLKFYDEKVPMFHKYGLEDEIVKIQRRRVDLPGGGSVVIDPTEALVAIDVNSGNFRVSDDAERTAYEMNLRAAKEIARQLRLRDLGGVIVNDFIDMRDERYRRGVERALRDAIRRDRARTKVLRMSQFGMIEMTRQRIRPSLKRSSYEDCPHCSGAGVVKTAESMAIDVMRLLALAANRPDIHHVSLSVAAPVEAYLNNRKRAEIAKLESDGLLIHVRHEPDAPGEYLHLDCFDAAGNEVRLLPPNGPAASAPHHHHGSHGSYPRRPR